MNHGQVDHLCWVEGSMEWLDLVEGFNRCSPHSTRDIKSTEFVSELCYTFVMSPAPKRIMPK